jgi:hypothetical protein
MVNYADGKVYKIIDNTNGNIYIGSTTVSLNIRLSHHKNHYKRYLVGKGNFIGSFDILKNNDFSIVLIEQVENAKCKEDLLTRERHFMNSMDCVNKNTGKSFNRKEYDKQYNKQYYAATRNERLTAAKEKTLCDLCDSCVNKLKLNQHKQTMLCIKRTIQKGERLQKALNDENAKDNDNNNNNVDVIEDDYIDKV